jgi:hypothetical protein
METERRGNLARLRQLWLSRDASDLVALGIFLFFVLYVVVAITNSFIDGPNFGGFWEQLGDATRWLDNAQVSFFGIVLVLIAWWKLQYQFSFELDDDELVSHCERIQTIAVAAVVVTIVQFLGVVLSAASNFVLSNFSGSEIAEQVWTTMVSLGLELVVILAAWRLIVDLRSAHGARETINTVESLDQLD